MTGTSSLSGQKLIDAASLFYAVKKISKTPSSVPDINRQMIEKHIHDADAANGHTSEGKFLRWHWAYMSDQELVLYLCKSPAYLPNTGMLKIFYLQCLSSNLFF